MKIAFDIETACGVGCEGACDHALDSHRNRVTVIGAYWDSGSCTFRDVAEFGAWVRSIPDAQLVAQNGKFDIRTLAVKGLDLRDLWTDDTLLMAATLTEKIPDEWLQEYEFTRKQLNEEGAKHRAGSKHTLKCLAPYFLGVEPFWETANHDNDGYVLKDCEYTYKLATLFKLKLAAEGTYQFYKEKLLPWTKMLVDAELRGVALDLDALDAADESARAAALVAKEQLDSFWAPAYAAYMVKQQQELGHKYTLMATAAFEKLKVPSSIRKSQIEEKYRAMFRAAAAKLEPFNLGSPAQLAWLLRDYLGLDICNFEGKESTGKVVLKRLSVGRPDIQALLDHRKQSKLVSAFFPAYRAMHVAGTLHCSFHPVKTQQDNSDDETGTKRGRLSSSNPNLQQVPGHLHRLFRARHGYKIITKDMSAIEPRLIAYYTQDENLYNIVATGQDFHGYTTKVLFEEAWAIEDIKREHTHERNMGKRIGLMLFYGAGAGGLQRTAQEFGFQWSKRECYRKLEAFKDFYSGVFRFRDEVINPALESGQAIPTLLGRPLRVEDKRDVHMQGFNGLIQVSASDLVQESALRIARAAQPHGAHVLLLVHDEIVVECPAASTDVVEAIMDDSMTCYNLHTSHGPVRLAVEGKIADFWEK